MTLPSLPSALSGSAPSASHIPDLFNVPLFHSRLWDNDILLTLVPLVTVTAGPVSRSLLAARDAPAAITEEARHPRSVIGFPLRHSRVILPRGIHLHRRQLGEAIGVYGGSGPRKVTVTRQVCSGWGGNSTPGLVGPLQLRGRRKPHASNKESFPRQPQCYASAFGGSVERDQRLC
ncbi:hypothetical protein AAFF_G00253150 [Aldrovandia affinis]|uniref:Uncharacterized protein n=1 Tax=Aldrovandia affinis TaxID=143900 RepID=A0AAD7STU3_9TELE|nr:hypothetical protein AAFF_G00253150 [Aldrovandia affinis]